MSDRGAQDEPVFPAFLGLVRVRNLSRFTEENSYQISLNRSRSSRLAQEPLVAQAKRHRGGPPPVLPDRLFFEAVPYLGRTGIPLRDLPGEFGEWDPVYNRLRRWVRPVAMNRLFEGMTADPQFGEVRRVLIDSATARAHRHAAGCGGRKKSGVGRSAAAEGPGRGGGGLTTRVVVTAAAESTPLAAEVVAGPRHDAPRLRPMVAATAARVGPIDRVVGDEGFGGAPQRRACRDRGAEPVIPARENRVDPEPLDEAAYRGRNVVERPFRREKEFRRVATRYDKRAANFLGGVWVASIATMLA